MDNIQRYTVSKVQTHYGKEQYITGMHIERYSDVTYGTCPEISRSLLNTKKKKKGEIQKLNIGGKYVTDYQIHSMKGSLL